MGTHGTRLRPGVASTCDNETLLSLNLNTSDVFTTFEIAGLETSVRVTELFV